MADSVSRLVSLAANFEKKREVELSAIAYARGAGQALGLAWLNASEGKRAAIARAAEAVAAIYTEEEKMRMESAPRG